MDIFTTLKSFGDRFFRRGEISFDDFKKVTDFARELNDWLRDILPVGPEVVSNLTYSQALSYFSNHRPADPRVTKGAMLLQQHPQGQLISQLFLDKKNNLVCDSAGKPYGRRLVVRNLDAELQETFGGKDLVIVE